MAAKKHSTTKQQIPSTGKFKCYNRETKDWDLYFNGQYIGSAANPTDGDTVLDQTAYAGLARAA
jgi:hypothetical protein